MITFNAHPVEAVHRIHMEFQAPAMRHGEIVFSFNLRTYLDEIIDHLIWGTWVVDNWLPIQEGSKH